MTIRYMTSAIRSLIMPLLWAVAILVTGSATTMAQTTAPTNALNAAVSSAHSQSNTWSNPTFALTSDDSRATSTLQNSGNNQKKSQYLDITNYGFEIPVDATILGIKVNVERSSTVASSVVDDEVKLLKAGSPVNTDKKSESFWPDSDEVASYGGVADLWGTTWTPAQINALNFGFRLRANNSTSNATVARVDAITIEVTYSVPAEEPEGPGDPELDDEARPTGVYRSVKTGTWNDKDTWEQEMINGATKSYVAATQYPSTDISVLGTAKNQKGNAGFTHDITIPVGTQAGDMLVVLFSSRFTTEANVHVGAGWTKLIQDEYENDGNNEVTGAVFYKIASTNNNLTISTQNSVHSSHITYRIQGAKRVFGASSNGNSSSPNPPVLSPDDGAQDYLWMTTMHIRGDNSATIAPIDFSGLVNETHTTGNNGASTASAVWANNVSSLDPSAFTASGSNGWVSFTLALDAGDPTAAAIVRDEHVVTTTATVKTLSVIVEDGGTLVVNNDVAMSVANGSAMEIEDGGTLDMLTGTSLVDGPGSFALQSGGTMKIGSNQGIHSSGSYGNIRVDGTRSYSTGGYYVYQGTSQQDPGAGLPSSVAGLEINNSGFGLLFLVNQEVTDQLTLTQGIIHMNGNVLTVSNDEPSAISGGSATSFVSGELHRGIAAGVGTYAFPIGSGVPFQPTKISLNVGSEINIPLPPTPVYAPVSVTFKAGSSAGVLAASTTEGDHLGVGISRIDALKTVNRTWVVSPTSGLEDVSYAISFEWNPNDEDTDFEHLNAYLGKDDEGKWTYPSISNRLATSLTAIGLTSFSQFQIGNMNPPVVINGYKFNDLNGNGTWDSNEPGLAGWTIQIQGSAGSHARVTDASGFYAFEDILPGQYQVREVNQAGWVQSAPGGEGFVNVSLTEARQMARVDFGNWKYSTISGSVYKDLSGEGARDASSQDFPGVTVQLINLSNVLIGSIETDADGSFVFNDVAPGHYVLRVISPQGYSQSFPGSGSGYIVIVTSGSELEDYEFGLFQPVILTGFVYLTEVSKAVGGDGQIQDLIPAGITVSGVRTGPAPLKLAYASNSFEFELPEDGFFYVDNLLPGLYQVEVHLPELFFAVTENPIIVQLNANIEIEIAFGIAYDVENAPEVTTSSISGSVFFDADGSGTWTASELGAGSQTVSLSGKSLRGDEVTRNTTSASDGSFTFNELPGGDYHVSVTPSGGLSSGWPMSGGLKVNLGKNEAVGGARLAVSAMATAQSGNDASFAQLTLAIDSDLDGTADTRVDVSGKMMATLGGFAGQGTRPAAVVSFSGFGTDNKGNSAIVSAPGMYGSTGTVTTVAGQSSATLGMGFTVVLNGQVLYASAPVSLSGNVTGWPFRGVAFSNAGQASVDLRDPFGHIRARIILAEFTPLHGVDLGIERADFGDAPNTYGTSRASYGDAFVVQGGNIVYPTDGARHLMPLTGNPSLMLGTGITADSNGKPSDLADADTDDGVTMPGTVSKGGTLDMDITVTGVGKLSAWADWNRDGSFGAGEQIITDFDVDGSFGVYNLSATVPSTASEGLTFVRFRLTSSAGVGPVGMALDGEVEDYMFTIVAPKTDGDGDDDGDTGTPTNDDGDSSGVPSEFRLGQNYPNPFNPSTVIPFELAQTGSVRLAVYDVTGRQVALLVNASMSTGRHSVTFNAAGIPSGVYIVRLEAGGRIMTNKLTLLK